jgi:hypothetical protein
LGTAGVGMHSEAPCGNPPKSWLLDTWRKHCQVAPWRVRRERSGQTRNRDQCPAIAPDQGSGAGFREVRPARGADQPTECLCSSASEQKPGLPVMNYTFYPRGSPARGRLLQMGIRELTSPDSPRNLQVALMSRRTRGGSRRHLRCGGRRSPRRRGAPHSPAGSLE